MSDSPDSPAATPGLRLAGSMRRLIDALSRNEIAGEKLSEACALAEQMEPLLAGPRRARWYEAGQGDSQSQGAHDAYLDQSAIRGELNPIAPPLVVERAVRDDATPCVRGHARMSLPYEGPPRGVHGGWVAALMDDLLGELMGDEEEEIVPEEASRTLPDEWRVSTAMSLKDFGEQAGVPVPEEQFNTVGGFVASLIQGQMAVGAEAEHAGIGFVITETQDERIVEIAVYDLEDEENRPETEETLS